MHNKKSPESHQDFNALNLPFNQSEFAQYLILHWCKVLEGGTEDKFKKIQCWRCWQ